MNRPPRRWIEASEPDDSRRCCLGSFPLPTWSSLLAAGVVDAVISGDACEWEAFEYAEDWISAGEGKALILLGTAVSMNPGAAVLGHGRAVD